MLKHVPARDSFGGMWGLGFLSSLPPCFAQSMTVYNCRDRCNRSTLTGPHVGFSLTDSDPPQQLSRIGSATL